MRIADLMKQRDTFVSLEFFPPKDRADWPGFFQVVDELKEINPLFVSVTYGAGGTTRDATLEIVTKLKKDHGVEPMAHLTCVGASEEGIKKFVGTLEQAHVENILALRGDPPEGMENFVPDNETFQHASDLVSFIKEHFPQTGIGVAGYPEVHTEAPDMETDLKYLKKKLDLGGEFVITQLFYENSNFFSFLQRAREMGITKPIIPGILPIVNLKSVKRILSMSGAAMPEDFMEDLKKADRQGGNEAVAELGIDYAKKQIKELLDNGVPGIHLYTLNRTKASMRVVEGLDLSG